MWCTTIADYTETGYIGKFFYGELGTTLLNTITRTVMLIIASAVL